MSFSARSAAQLKGFHTKPTLPIFLVNSFVNDYFPHIFRTEELLGFSLRLKPTYLHVKECYRCQAFDHSSFNCGFDPVFVKSAGKRNSKGCSIFDPSQLQAQIAPEDTPQISAAAQKDRKI